MAFNPFNLFKGNPKADKSISELLLEQSFVSQFKKTENENLQKYMNYDRYAQLIKYITIIECNQTNKNRAFKHILKIYQISISSEILSVSNELTFKYLLEEVVFAQEVVEEEVQVEKQLDSESSDRSYSSIKSNNSSTSKKQAFQNKQYEESDKQNFILRDDNDKVLADYEFKDEKDICQEDFPDVRQKKIVMVRQLVKKTIKKPYQPLILMLLTYFQNQNVIHILDGYVSRVLENIINNRLPQFLKIIDKYDAFNKIKRIFSHLQSNSVQQFLLNFITKIQQTEDPIALTEQIVFIQFIQRICEIPFSQWPNKESVLQEKAYILNLYCSIVQKINVKINTKIEGQQQKQEKASFATQLKEVYKLIRAQHITKLIEILSQIINTSTSFIKSKITLHYCKLIKLILKSFTIVKALQQKASGTVQNKEIKNILESCEDCFDPIIQTAYAYIFQDVLHIEKQDQANYKFRNSLISKMEFIEIMGILAKENIYFSKRTIIDHPSFQHFLKILDFYPKSSILHNGILNIISPFICIANQDIIIQKLFRKGNFFLSLFEIVQNDSELRYQKKDRNRKCYIAQITSICIAIQRLQNQCQELNEYKMGQQWQFICQYLIKDQKGLQKKVLGGHQKLRDKQPQICFSKQECLQKFKYFLSGLKLNLFDDFQNYEPNNSDSQEEKDREERNKSEFISEQTKIEAEEDNSKYFAQDYVL